MDGYVESVSDWVSELWFLRIFSAPGNVLRAECEGDECGSFYYWTYSLTILSIIASSFLENYFELKVL